MRIALVAGEFNQVILHTGLCSVVRDLARELNRLGHQVRVLLPYFGAADQNKERHHGLTMRNQLALNPIVQLHGCPLQTCLAQAANTLEGVAEVWLLNTGDCFRNIRNTGAANRISWADRFDKHGEFCDPALALAMVEFNRLAACLLSGSLGNWTAPDLVHCFGWEAALVPSFLRRANPRLPTLLTVDLLTVQAKIGSVQGRRLRRAYKACQVPQPVHFDNFLRRGILNAHRLHFPSLQWFEDTTGPTHGHGVGPDILSRKHDVCIAPFAINPKSFDHREKLKEERFASSQLFAEERVTPELKRLAKRELQRRLGLPEGGPILLAGNRLSEDDQKNYRLIRAALPRLLNRWPRMQLILRLFPSPTEGTPATSHLWTRLERLVTCFASPRRVVINPLGLADSIKWELLLLGSDVVLCPSLFEPGGLNHRQALFYGCPVVATRRGDMAAIIRDPRDRSSAAPNGWLFDDPTDSLAFEECIDDLAVEFHDPEAWRRIVLNCLNTPVTWAASIGQYIECYHKLTGQGALSAQLTRLTRAQPAQSKPTPRTKSPKPRNRRKP